MTISEPPSPTTPPVRPRIAPPEDLPLAANPKSVNRSVGYIAFLMPFALLASGKITGLCAAQDGLDSLSHYYFSRIGGTIFVGALTVISVLMLFFYSRRVPPGRATGTAEIRADGFVNFTRMDMILVRVAGAAAFLIALFPTSGIGCESADLWLRGFSYVPGDVGTDLADGMAGGALETTFGFWDSFGVPQETFFAKVLGSLHYGAAAVMFAILGYFSLVVFTRVQSPDALREGVDESGPRAKLTELTWRKKTRNAIYALCGITIFAAILALGIKQLVDPAIYNRNNLTFWFEWAALAAFGLSWLVKGRFISWLNDPHQPERKHVAVID
ncbi:hypothetical protein [Litorisediminicola beolgyonensis]|uniref:Uncharacterized protein n=1 Tax=Litorisediminicola beolgyonensis TaxID=1173614 RepID=A0ABW3ZDD4_9RHOB